MLFIFSTNFSLKGKQNFLIFQLLILYFFLLDADFIKLLWNLTNFPQ